MVLGVKGMMVGPALLLMLVVLLVVCGRWERGGPIGPVAGEGGMLRQDGLPDRPSTDCRQGHRQSAYSSSSSSHGTRLPLASLTMGTKSPQSES